VEVSAGYAGARVRGCAGARVRGERTWARIPATIRSHPGIFG
jgi:hypothetical protein